MDIEPYVLLLLGVCLIFGGFFVDSIADKAMPDSKRGANQPLSSERPSSWWVPLL
jgi:hypothetical protein